MEAWAAIVVGGQKKRHRTKGHGCRKADAEVTSATWNVSMNIGEMQRLLSVKAERSKPPVRHLRRPCLSRGLAPAGS